FDFCFADFRAMGLAFAGESGSVASTFIVLLLSARRTTTRGFHAVSGVDLTWPSGVFMTEEFHRMNSFRQTAAKNAAGMRVDLKLAGFPPKMSEMVEPRGIEPLTSAMPLQRSPS